MPYYAAIDLHSNNQYLAVQDETGRVVAKKRLPNQIGPALAMLAPFKEQVKGIVVESTYNWYWLVDGLMDEGYRVHLANPSAMQKYSGLKHSDDKDDAIWLGEMLRLGILPQGYIYPTAERSARDLLRRRMRLVRQRTSLINSLQGVVERNFGCRLSTSKIKASKENHVLELLSSERADLRLSGQILKECIDFFGNQIHSVEKFLLERETTRDDVNRLLAVPGIGPVLGLTIVLESGPMGRFPGVGDYSSYCRKTPSDWTSNEKTKGHGNTRNGNPYLAWAFGTAAMLMRCNCSVAKRYFEKKAARSHPCVAYHALAHKLTRAVYYVLRDGAPFDLAKMFR